MEECATCKYHYGIQKEIEGLRILIDEREKQATIHLHNYERSVEIEKEQLTIARQQIDHRLEGMNQFQKRIDRLEATFATKDELASISRMVYVGFGIIIAVQFLFRYLKFL